MTIENVVVYLGLGLGFFISKWFLIPTVLLYIYINHPNVLNNIKGLFIKIKNWF